jgi:putative ABC transport system ATP-binding protein
MHSRGSASGDSPAPSAGKAVDSGAATLEAPPSAATEPLAPNHAGRYVALVASEPLLSARGLGRAVHDPSPAPAGSGPGRLLARFLPGGRPPADRRPSRFLFRHLDLDLAPGERLAVTGDSGSGKTLLLRSLVRLDPVDEGRVYHRGREVRGRTLPAFRSRVILLHQRPSSLADTVEADLRVAFALRFHRGTAFPRDRAAALLAELGRDETFLSRSTQVLSGGEAQLVALVRALLLDPEVLLLDEATASLDPTTTAAAERAIRTFLAAGERACAFVAHDPAQLERLATRRLAIADFRPGETGR